MEENNMLRRLASNRQVPDDNRLTVTVGELRAALAPALEPKRLATAIRMVERLRDEKQGNVWQGPEPEWYDEYTEEVLAQYEALADE